MPQHKELAQILSTIDGKFLLSYNDCEEIRYTLGSNAHHEEKKVQEIFITNF